MIQQNDFLVFPSSSELVRIPGEAILFVEACGNYSIIHTIDGKTRELVLQLGKIEEIASKVRSLSGRFIRIGRSLIANKNFITYINVNKQRLEISDAKTFVYELSASKEALRSLREYLIQEAMEKTNEVEEMTDNAIRVIVFREKEAVIEDNARNTDELEEPGDLQLSMETAMCCDIAESKQSESLQISGIHMSKLIFSGFDRDCYQLKAEKDECEDLTWGVSYYEDKNDKTSKKFFRKIFRKK